MNPSELLNHLAFWEERVEISERAAAYAREQQARIVGELAAQGVLLYPRLDEHGDPIMPKSHA